MLAITARGVRRALNRADPRPQVATPHKPLVPRTLDALRPTWDGRRRVVWDGAQRDVAVIGSAKEHPTPVTRV
jgi:hypothetical protein